MSIIAARRMLISFSPILVKKPRPALMGEYRAGLKTKRGVKYPADMNEIKPETCGVFPPKPMLNYLVTR